MATLLYNASGLGSPFGSTQGVSYQPYGFNAIVPGFGAAIPAAQLPAYAPGCVVTRFVQNSGASGPITNANLVVDIISNTTAAVGSEGVAGTDGHQPGEVICVVYTVAGGVLT